MTKFLSTPSARRATHLPPVVFEVVLISIHALREEGDVDFDVLFAFQCDFYPRPPRGGRRTTPPRSNTPSGFLSTPSARRATGLALLLLGVPVHFYPRPPRGGRPNSTVRLTGNRTFLSTPSARRATDKPYADQLKDKISIHALREEGDTPKNIGSGRPSDFYPRPPRGGRHMPCLTWRYHNAHFYPRPPRGGRPAQLKKRQTIREISIHALREEGDRADAPFQKKSTAFLSTPSARRATRVHLKGEASSWNFYPRPPRGGRPVFCMTFLSDFYFYPRPPRGGRPRPEARRQRSRRFLSTPSARRATSFRIAYRR